MEKKILIIIVFFTLAVVIGLYYTYAVDISSDSTAGDADLTFDVSIKNPATRTVSVPAGKTKIFDIFLKNTSSVKANYGVAYSGTKPSTVRIAQFYSSKDQVSGLINSNATKQITIIIINDSSSNYTYTISPVVGYEHGGSLIVPDNYTLITDIYSIPNKPALVDGLVPVKYDTTNGWVKADVNNSNNDWYDYDEKKWANAVLVSSTNRTTYMNASVGTVIPESDVLAYYVWIPRYKYKVWNINKVISANSYNAKTEGIDIVFEYDNRSTGTVSCNYDFTVVDLSLSEICTGANGDYYTHPAFTFGNDELRGIWVGKFEISSEDPSITYGGGNVTNLTVRVKPNVASWKSNTVSNFYKVIYDMQTTNNIYGLNTSRTNTDSHMLKNIEWGAVAYLTNSKYGRCNNNTCTEVTINNSSTYITGNAGDSISASAASGITNAYNTTAGQLASTTGNIYGIYDMSGGSSEYVMGNMSSGEGSYTYFAHYGGENFSYNSSTEKYIDTYTYFGSSSTYSQYDSNRSRLGDATGETKGWYSDYGSFVYKNNPWFTRGGDSGSHYTGLFSFDCLRNSFGGINSSSISSRATLVSLQ